jgi:hypothetical protein
MTLYTYSLLIRIVLLDRKDVLRGYVATAILATVLLFTLKPIPPGMYITQSLFDYLHDGLI